MGAYCQDLGNGYMRCANTPFAGAAWLLEAPAVEGSGHELRPTLSTVSGEFLGAEGRDAPTRFESQFAARPLADAANGYANAEASYNVASENAVTLDTSFGGPVTGALSGESAMDAVFRQAREEIVGVKVLTPASGDRADVGLPLSPYGVGSSRLSPGARLHAGFDTADTRLDNGNIAQLLGFNLGRRQAGTVDEIMLKDPALASIAGRSGYSVKPITQDPSDDKIPPPPPGEDPWGWAEKHGIMPDPGYGVPSLPTGESVGSCYCMLQCGRPIKTKPVKGTMNSAVWLGQPDNNTSCSLTEGEYLPCRLIIASRDGATMPRQPYYIVEMIYSLGSGRPVQFAEPRVSIFLDGEQVPDIKPPVNSNRLTPCPSEVRFWIRADKPGPVLIHTGWNGMQPCGELRLNIAPLAYMMAYAPEQKVVPPVIARPLPPEPPKPDILGDCGCEITCASLDLDNKPAQDKFQKGGCTITVDMTDPDAVRGTFVLGVLKLVGDDPVNLYGWSVQCLNDWLELNEHIDFGDEGTADPSIGSEFHGLMHGDAKCGTEIPFLLRPTEAAYEALEKGDVGTLIETVIGKVGQQECPMEVYITGSCDLEQFKLSLPTRRLPKVQLTLLPGNFVMPDNRRLPINMMMPEESRRSEEYKYLPPGFSGGQGWSLFLHRKIEVDVESKWVPNDCCCLYVNAIKAELRIDMVIEHPHFGFWQEDLACLERAGEYLMSSKFARELNSLVANDLKRLNGISGFPICRRDTKAECDTWARDVQALATSVVNNNVNLLMAPLLACQTSCQKYRSAGDYTLVNARGLIEYVLEPYSVASMISGAIVTLMHPLIGIPLFLNAVHGASHAARASGYDKAIVALTNDYALSPDEDPCEIVIWVHGFTNGFGVAAPRIAHAESYYRKLSKGTGKFYGFVWKSDPFDSNTEQVLDFFGVLKVDIPGLDGLGETQFNAGEMAADISADGLANFIYMLSKVAPHARINLVAHSLGCRVALQALRLLRIRGVTLNTATLIEAAVDHDILATGKEFAISPTAVQMMYIVHSRHDEVLAGMTGYYGQSFFGYKGGLLGSTALGVYGPYPSVAANNVRCIDMSDAWRTKPVVPGEPGATIHSSVYFKNYNEQFFTSILPRMLNAEDFGACNYSGG